MCPLGTERDGLRHRHSTISSTFPFWEWCYLLWIKPAWRHRAGSPWQSGELGTVTHRCPNAHTFRTSSCLSSITGTPRGVAPAHSWLMWHHLGTPGNVYNIGCFCSLFRVGIKFRYTSIWTLISTLNLLAFFILIREVEDIFLFNVWPERYSCFAKKAYGNGAS